MSLEIRELKLIFKNSKKLGIAGIQEDFILPFEEIKVIGLKFMYILDEDEYFLIIINKNGHYYFINSAYIIEESFNKLQIHFNIKIKISSFNDSFYRDGKSIILYPAKYYGLPIFRSNKSFLDLSSLIIEKLLFKKITGMKYLSKECKDVLKNN